jgi:hypothetical protein
LSLSLSDDSAACHRLNLLRVAYLDEV